MKQQKKQRVIQNINKDFIYEIIDFLAPFEVIQLCVLSHDWNETIKSSIYWKKQVEKNWKLPLKVDNYFNYFKESFLSFQNSSYTLGNNQSRTSCTFSGEPFNDQLKIEYELELPFKINQRNVIFISDYLFMYGKTELACFSLKTKQEVWKIKYKKSEMLYLDYNILFDLLIFKSDSKIQAIHPKKGKIIWEYKVFNCTTFIMKGNTIIFGIKDYTQILCLDIESGKEIWLINTTYKEDSKIFICSKGKFIFFFPCLEINILEFESFHQPPKIITKDLEADDVSEVLFCGKYMVVNSSLDQDYYQYFIPLDNLESGFLSINGHDPISSSFDEKNRLIYTKSYISGGGGAWDIDIFCSKLEKNPQRIGMIPIDDEDLIMKMYNLEGKLNRKFLRLYGSFLSNIIIKDDLIYFIAEWGDFETLFCCYRNDGKNLIPVFMKELEGIVSYGYTMEETFQLWMEDGRILIINQSKIVSIIQE